MKKLNDKKSLYIFSLAGALMLSEAGAANVNEKFSEASSSKEVVEIETLIRQQKELDASNASEKAIASFKEKNYKEAISFYEKAIKSLKEAGSTTPRIEEKLQNINASVVSVYEKWTEELLATAKGDAYTENFNLAINKLEKAYALKDVAGLDDIVVKKLKADLDYLNEQREKKEFRVAVDARSIKGEVKELTRITNILFDQAKILYSAKKYMECKEVLERTLVEDPYHTGAVRLLKRVYGNLNLVAEERRDEILSDRNAEMNWKWSEPISTKTGSTSESDFNGAVPLEAEEASTLKSKLATIKLPVVKYKNARIEDIINDLKTRSRELDPENKGINILYLTETKSLQENVEDVLAEDEEVAEESATEEDPWAEEEESEEESDTTSSEDRLLTLEFENISLGDFVKFVCNAAGLRYKVEEYAVVIAGENVILDEMDTRFIPVPAGFMEIIATRKAESISGLDDDADEEPEDEEVQIQPYFESLGILFPKGAKIEYIAKLNRIVITNNIKQLDAVATLIEQLSIKPSQVMIEAKFVEVNQTDLEGVGFDWFLTNTQDFNIGSISGDFGGQIPLAVAEATGIASNDVLTNGLRNFQTSLDQNLNVTPTFALKSTIGNFELEGFITAIEQKTNSDILSAPKLTARNGETAVLRVVEERFFPVNWEKPEIERSGSGDSNIPVLKPSIPEFDEARDLGVTFEVTPQIDPDGLSMELALKPEIIEFIGFDNRFSYQLAIGTTTPTITDIPQIFIPGFETTGITRVFGSISDETVVDIPLRMPIISARTVDTTVRVWDGETVMIGGLLREETIKTEDSIKYLSDIPFIGRLFESKGFRREKNHLLIFVTSRLINSAGLPLRSNFDKGLPDYKRI